MRIQWEMLNISDNTKLPKHYIRDLTIDMITVSEHKSEPFIWILRENGTQLYFEHHSVIDYIHVEYPEALFYFYDGNALRAIEYSDISNLLIANE